MKVDKLTKLENDVFRMQDVVAESQRRLEVLQKRYTQARNDRIIEMVTQAGISVDEVRRILQEYDRKKNEKEEPNETEYVYTEEDH
ncbi:MAG: DUF4315 family protein [Parasporobacterium sp.]|nr:DUF4315 family protein [Parasporobacterium sp.]